MNDKSKSINLLKGTGIYAIGTFGSKFLSILIVPLYTYYLTTEEMGIYDLLISTVSLLSPIVTMQISDAAYRWIIRGDGDISLYIRSTLQVLLCNCSLAVLLIFGVNHFFTIPYCAYFALFLLCARILGTMQKLLRALKKQKLYALSGIVHSLVFLSLNVYLVCYLRKGVSSLLFSAVVSHIVTILLICILVPELRVNVFKKPDLKTIGEFYRFSVPLVPNYLNWWIINSSDRYIVLFFLGVSSNGILAITHKFPSLLHTILTLFTTSWQDVSISDRETDTGKYYTTVFRKFSRLTLAGLWALIPFTKVVAYYVLGPAYKVACNYIAFYYIGAVFQSFASFYGVGYLRNKQTGKAFSTSIYAALINAVTNLALVRFIGLHASAFSTFAAFFVMWLIREKQNREELGIVANRAEVFLFTGICIAVSLISILTNSVANIILFMISSCAFVVINREEIRIVFRFLQSRIKKLSA